MIKLAIFDLDGTLINSLQDLANAVNYTLKLHGYPLHELDEFKYFVGNGMFELLRRSLPDDMKSDEYVLSIKPDFEKHYSENYVKNTYEYDGIKELLEELKNKGISLAVATNKPDEFAKKIVSEIFGDTFDYVKGFTKNIPKKPSPEIVYHILDAFDTDSLDAVFIGDSNVDIYTGKNSGLKSIGCLWGFRTEEELLSSGADFIAKTPFDIYKFIEKEM